MRGLPSRRPAPVLLSLALAVVAAAVVGAIALHGGGVGSSDITVTGGGARQGDQAPAFSGTGVDGSRVDLAGLRGRVVLVNFFATWCSNCRAEEPLLEQTARQYASRGLVVVGVGWHESGDGRAFLRELGVTYPALLDSGSRIGDAYGVTDLPESVWVGRDGRISLVFRGQLSTETLDPELHALIG